MYSTTYGLYHSSVQGGLWKSVSECRHTNADSLPNACLRCPTGSITLFMTRCGKQAVFCMNFWAITPTRTQNNLRRAAGHSSSSGFDPKIMPSALATLAQSSTSQMCLKKELKPHLTVRLSSTAYLTASLLKDINTTSVHTPNSAESIGFSKIDIWIFVYTCFRHPGTIKKHRWSLHTSRPYCS